jgi:aspartyl-tRNA(Asn)/glutamyl-tRNA(Gln) amidotransferase subunit C
MVDRETVRHVAKLAKLRLSPEEEERLVGELGEILEYVEQLAEADARSGEARELTHVAPVPAPLRPDEPRPGLPRDQVLALAPASDGETLRVPAVLDGGGAA